jgi:hypothetical protein
MSEEIKSEVLKKLKAILLVSYLWSKRRRTKKELKNIFNKERKNKKSV